MSYFAEIIPIEDQRIVATARAEINVHRVWYLRWFRGWLDSLDKGE
jgi:hypothetical protein